MRGNQKARRLIDLRWDGCNAGPRAGRPYGRALRDGEADGGPLTRRKINQAILGRGSEAHNVPVPRRNKNITRQWPFLL